MTTPQTSGPDATATERPTDPSESTSSSGPEPTTRGPRMPIPKQTATMLPLAFLVPHPNNVRKHLGDVSELAASIRQNGLVQPIIVTQHPFKANHYLILAGHRRHAAATRVGMKQVPCIIRHDVGHMADHLQLMLVENVQRTQLSPVEKAEAIRELMALGLTQSDVARATGMHASTVNTLILINDLDEQTLEAVKAGDLTVGAAQEAVRKERAASRERLGGPTAGRPVQVDPPHFRRSHPLAGHVHDLCDHSTRPKVGNTGCGQCWEEIIRVDALQGIGGGIRCRSLRLKSTRSRFSAVSMATTRSTSARPSVKRQSASSIAGASTTGRSPELSASRIARCCVSVNGSGWPTTTSSETPSGPDLITHH